MKKYESGLYIELSALAEYAMSSARLKLPQQSVSCRSAISALRQDYRLIMRTHAEIDRRFSDRADIPAEYEWLLDNIYMVQREFRTVLSEMNGGEKLRSCENGIMLSGLCSALTASGLGEITEERCREFLAGFQKITVLTRAELKLFPAFLKASVIAAIAEACAGLYCREEGDDCARRLGALFTSLRLFSVLNTEKITDDADIPGQILSSDPSGEFPRLDRMSRQSCLERLNELAARQNTAEHVMARRIAAQAAAEKKSVCELLFAEHERGAAAKAGVYIAANVLLPLFFSLIAAFSLKSPAAALLLLIPLSSLVKNLLDHVIIRHTKPKRLLRIDTSEGVPPEGKSICVYSVLISSANDGARLASKLEQLYFACRTEGRNVSFGLLADLPSSAKVEREDDKKLISSAASAVAALNRRYGGGFYLFTRKRSFNGECYTGHERKRGAITELAKLLCGRENALQVFGDAAALEGTKYIITLDSDTRVYPGSVGELIGAAVFSLCKPVIDKHSGTVIRGHAVIQPRISTSLASAQSTDFALVFAGSGGSDPYGTVCGEMYMDTFGSGGFSGKGIIDAAALLECTASIPDNSVLSHDALEGAYLRGAYMGDAEFSDGFPASVRSYYKRLHRWVRGDWQNSPWLFSRGRAFPAIERWRLFDSIRRSMVAPASLFAILVGFFSSSPGLRLAAWAALLALFNGIIVSLTELARSGGTGSRKRYFRVFTGLGGAIVRTFFRLWLLPHEAWICLSAALTSLWRMLVSHKRLLQWQTFEQAESSTELAADIRMMWFSVCLGLILMVFSPAVIGSASGFMWLLSPVAAYALSLPAHRSTALTEKERKYIRSAAGESWRYFSECSGEQDNFLPPDNFQEQPPVGIAHRTSPTNIGLALASAAAVCDMGIIEPEAAVEYIKRVTDTLEKMPRYKGHFFNWYDTRTLSALEPAYISTVDSGNLCACLLCTCVFLEEQGAGALALRLRQLTAEMDFSFLYDSSRDLFYICYDSANRRGAGGWYDLMASEALLTSYLAAARGDIPVRHWRHLSRALLQKDGFRGLASWTGTMFEYLMPAMLLPYCRGSLLGESARFCVYAQKKRTEAGMPWGISESAYFSLDSALNYRYKAHGVGALALKRDQDSETVVSPYSSFLALCIDPHGAVRNLKNLELAGAKGRYGFREAVDYTLERTGGHERAVCCFMAHHIGMSIVSASNALCGDIAVRRFTSLPEMQAFSLLLEEEFPEHAAVIRRGSTEVPERKRRFDASGWTVSGTAADELQAGLMSNGIHSVMSTSFGNITSHYGEYEVYSGIKLRLKSQNGSSVEILPGGCEKWSLGENLSRYSGKSRDISWTYECICAQNCCGEKHSIVITADMPAVPELELGPVLAQHSDYVNHPSYWQLGIEQVKTENGVLFRRIARGSCPELWLCVRFSCPVLFNGKAFELQINSGADNTFAACMALCVGKTRSEAEAGAKNILASAQPVSGGMVGAASAHLRMDAEDTQYAMKLLTELNTVVLTGAAPKAELWRYGISGEHPLICCDGMAAEAERVLKAFCLLRACGAEAELIYFTDECGEYNRPVCAKISSVLRHFGLEALIGTRGGIFFLPRSAEETVISRAQVCIGHSRSKAESAIIPELSASRQCSYVNHFVLSPECCIYYVNGVMSSALWQLILTNGSYGCIAADLGCAAMWEKNARELRITAPTAADAAYSSSESIFICDGDRSESIFASSGSSCTVSYYQGYVEWENEYRGHRLKTTMFVPFGTDARVVIIEGAKGLKLRWILYPMLSGSDAACVRISGNGILCAENPEAYISDLRFYAACSSNCSTRCRFAPAAMQFDILPDETCILVCGCGAEDEILSLCKQANAFSSLNDVKNRWSRLLDRVKITTGLSVLDNYVNRWAVYQTVACRLQARTSIYQSGGAFGFRDQLQDAVNMMLISPAYAHRQIMLSCAHQYVEGDVMHWWHEMPGGDKGVRTRCSDDLLWLVWALCEYTEATSDTDICALDVHYVNSPVLSGTEKDRYETPEISAASACVLDHARAALECFIRRGFGMHGLPFIGTGDWNDAFDDINGESVWLAWFAAHCMERFAFLLSKLCKPDSERYHRYAAMLAEKANASFNGRWFIRAYYPDGEAIADSDRIDSIAQSWAVLSGFGDPEKSAEAVSNALCKLIDDKHGIVRLFVPPFSADERSPGYISSYGKGYRENGGQYTHGAIWLASALFDLDMPDEAWRILKMLLPESHDMSVYQAEPFVIAADVSAAEGHEGEAGWTWYTGSSGWYFRIVAEKLLGLRLTDGKISFSPKLPREIGSISAVWTDSSGEKHEFHFEHP